MAATLTKPINCQTHITSSPSITAESNAWRQTHDHDKIPQEFKTTCGFVKLAALITASAADYYVDDRNNTIIRGDTYPSVFEAFWPFELEPTGWLLRDIEQSRESDYLKEENFFEMFTDLQIKKITVMKLII